MCFHHTIAGRPWWHRYTFCPCIFVNRLRAKKQRNEDLFFTLLVQDEFMADDSRWLLGSQQRAEFTPTLRIVFPYPLSKTNAWSLGRASVRVLSGSRWLLPRGVWTVREASVWKRVGWVQLGHWGEPAWWDEGTRWNHGDKGRGAALPGTPTPRKEREQGEPSLSQQQSLVGRCPVGQWVHGVSPPGTWAGKRRVQSGRQGQKARPPGAACAECGPAVTRGLEGQA